MGLKGSKEGVELDELVTLGLDSLSLESHLVVRRVFGIGFEVQLQIGGELIH